MSKKNQVEENKEQNSREDAVSTEEYSIKKEIFSYIRIIIMAAVLAFVVSEYVIFNATIPSASMEDTIMTGSRVIGFRLAYCFDQEVERGDIIIFKYPLDENQYYIKRVIGLPGETVEIRDGHVYIDGSETYLDETYLKEKWISVNDGLTYEVPEGSYFVMGDNRNVSQDARYWAGMAYYEGLADTEEEAMTYTFVKDEQILAKAVIEYWPKIKLIEE